MTSAAAIDAEVRRLAVLHHAGLLDSPGDPHLDALVRCAAQLSGCPMALMTLCDADRLWVKARTGTALIETRRDGAFCSEVVTTDAMLEVHDAPLDPRFASHPLVAAAPFVRYYAGAPLRLDGAVLGTLCVLDTTPRRLLPAQLDALQALAEATGEILRARQHGTGSDTERRRLLDFARASGDWMWETDAALRYTWISGAYDTITGECSDLQIGLPLADGRQLDNAGRTLPGGGGLHGLLRAGQPISRALIEQHCARGRLVISLSAVPVCDALGEVNGWRGTARDVTEPIREASRQRVENDLLAQVSANTPGVIYQFRRDADGTGRFEFVNQQAVKVFGLTPADMLADPLALYKIVHPDDVDELQRRIEDADARQRPIDLEYRIVHRDGQVRWVSSNSSRQRMADGSLVSHGFITDTTERKQTALALRASDQRWEIAASATGIGIAQLDMRDGRLILDDRARANHGLPPSSTSSDPGLALADWFAAIHPDDRASAESAVQQALAEGGRMAARYRFRRADGATPWLEVVAQVEHDAQGRAVSMIGTCRDVSAQIAVDELRSEKESAERASRAKTAFLSRVSHELRTPLNGILGFAQLMALDRQHSLAEVQQRRLEGVQRSGQHLLALINDVLDIARIEQDDFAPRLHAVALVDVVSRCVAEARPLAAARGVQLQIVVGRPLRVLADERALEQVLMNLLSNAIKFNRERGVVRIAVAGDGEHVRVSVEDEGPGLSAVQQADLFQPFNRLGAERRRIDGTGLGLVIARQLASAMNGRLGVHSAGTGGCCFTLDLQADATSPADDADDDDDERPTQPAALDDAPADRGAARQVLYIEDEALNRVLMEEVFRQHAGWVLHTARDGAEGLAIADELLPDLLLIDINLPDMTGLRVVQALRGNARTAGLHCIALSADALREQIEVARDAGFDDYWTKPIDVSQLLRTLQSTLARGRSVAW